MEYRTFGNTGIEVSLLGFGAGHTGSTEMDEGVVEQLLNEVLDLGINLIDTARSYGQSEQRIGKYLARRRNEFIISTKVGYTYRDRPDWSYDATMGGIEESLERMRTDYLDIVHLHSCDKSVLEQGDAILALERAKEQGKIRVAAYSGENEALGFALASNRFEGIQCSVNIFDQQNIDRFLPLAREKKMGLIAKRPLGNAVWRYQSRPDAHGHAVYYDRLQQMDLNLSGAEWYDVALRFSASVPGVGSLIAGTSRIEHLEENLKILEKGPLDQHLFDMLRTAFISHGENWEGLI